MDSNEVIRKYADYLVGGDDEKSDYLGLIKKLAGASSPISTENRLVIESVYRLLLDEIKNNPHESRQSISFGTSGWRGILGKDINVRSIAQVTTSIVEMYEAIDAETELTGLLGVKSSAEAKFRGCVLGFDNRFAGALLANVVAGVLVRAGFKVHYAGESTTGVLSAAVLMQKAAFSINLTPSHNPLDYGGYKFNAADGGPAADPVTERITQNAQRIVMAESGIDSRCIPEMLPVLNRTGVVSIDSLDCWRELIKQNEKVHGLSLNNIVSSFNNSTDIALVVDCVHGASRLHIKKPIWRMHSSTSYSVARFGGHYLWWHCT